MLIYTSSLMWSKIMMFRHLIKVLITVFVGLLLFSLASQAVVMVFVPLLKLLLIVAMVAGATLIINSVIKRFGPSNWR